jgi:hypothetical protein
MSPLSGPLYVSTPLINRTQGGGGKKISNHKVDSEITSFEPCYTRLSPDQSNNIILPSSEVSMYLDKALKVLGLVSSLSIARYLTLIS